MKKGKYTIRLTKKERKELKSIVPKGKSASRTIMRATVLLNLDSDAGQRCDIDELCKVLCISRRTIGKEELGAFIERNAILLLSRLK